MFRSSGLRSGNGRPYWIPTSRRVAASTRIAANATHGPPQRLVSDLGRCGTYQAGDVAEADDDGVDAGPLELRDLVSRPHLEVGDRALAGRDVRQEVEHALERVLGAPRVAG